MDLEDIILSEVTQSQKNTHGIHSLISGYQTRSSEYPKQNSQTKQSSRRMETKGKKGVWILRPFLEEDRKYPWQKIQRQSLEQRLKERPQRDQDLTPFPQLFVSWICQLCIHICSCEYFVPLSKKDQSIHTLVFLLLELHVVCELYPGYSGLISTYQ